MTTGHRVKVWKGKDRVWDRALTLIEKTDDCWLWRGYVGPAGYGRIRVDGHRVQVHRYIYESLIDPIPTGMELNHLCQVRHCVNPAHLELVSRGESVARNNRTERKPFVRPDLGPCADNDRYWVFDSRPLEERFWEKVARPDGKRGCWVWQGSDDGNGYGQIWFDGAMRKVHRVAYELLTDYLIPEGLTLDHLCRNRRCVNPTHLEPVTGAENTRRGVRLRQRKVSA